MEKETLVSISAACRMLGVSEPTLRQWTDEGRIKAFVTPGGHRRYSTGALKQFVSLNRKLLGIKDFTLKLEDSVALHREIALHFLQTKPWFAQLGPEDQQHFSVLGRQLLRQIMKLVSEPSKQEDNLTAIGQTGWEFGECTGRVGLPLIDSVQAFILHRDPILNITSEMMKGGDSLNRRVVEAIPLINRAMDAALLQLVASHQKVSDAKSTGNISAAGAELAKMAGGQQ
jgi:excisionase family DNA binding protein